MLRSPRDKFIASAHRAEFEKIVANPAFEEATLTALLDFQSELPLTTTPNHAADCHNMMAGARRFLSILCAIHQPESGLKAPKPPELDWTAGV